MKNYIKESSIDILEGEVTELIIQDKKVVGVKQSGKEFMAKTVIIATGTFLSSKIMMGEDIRPSGPDGKQTNSTIAKQLEELGHETMRLKTGTPPRIDIESIDLEVQIEEPGSDKPIYFSEKEFVNKEYQNIPA